MANADAWQAGLDLAKRGKGYDANRVSPPKKMQKEHKRHHKGGGGSDDGNPFSILTVLKKNFGGSMKKGGHVKRTAMYMLHKGERVIPAKAHKKSAARKRSVTKL
jgi:hypothetical protein